MYELSICIPTYNRARYLSELLDSIISQISIGMQGLLEVVISDNASSDETREIVRKYVETYPLVNIAYYINEVNIGFDQNMLAVAQRARGKYCWFMGSDDKLTEDALSIVFDAIGSGADLYLGDRIVASNNMKPIFVEKMFRRRRRSSKVYNFKDTNEFSRYFRDATNCASIFGYLSNILFKKEKWDRVIDDYDEVFTGSAFGFLFVLMCIAKLGSTFMYIDRSIVFCRTGNDTTFNPGNNFVKRFLLDVNGYGLLASRLFEEASVGRKGFYSVFRKQFGAIHYANLRLHCDLSQWMEIERRLKPFEVSELLLIVLRHIKPILIVSKSLILTLRKSKAKFVPSFQ